MGLQEGSGDGDGAGSAESDRSGDQCLSSEAGRWSFRSQLSAVARLPRGERWFVAFGQCGGNLEGFSFERTPKVLNATEGFTEPKEQLGAVIGCPSLFGEVVVSHPTGARVWC